MGVVASVCGSGPLWPGQAWTTALWALEVTDREATRCPGAGVLSPDLASSPGWRSRLPARPSLSWKDLWLSMASVRRSERTAAECRHCAHTLPTPEEDTGLPVINVLTEPPAELQPRCGDAREAGALPTGPALTACTGAGLKGQAPGARAWCRRSTRRLPEALADARGWGSMSLKTRGPTEEF